MVLYDKITETVNMVGCSTTDTSTGSREVNTLGMKLRSVGQTRLRQEGDT
jgi:hypothetical protein